MTTADALLILAALCDPSPYAGYGWRVNDELAARDLAVEQQRTATTSQEQRRAAIARDAAETRLAHLLNAQPQPRPAFEVDDGLDGLGTTAPTAPTAELYTCEACDRTADSDEFQAHEAREVDDCVCDECLAVQADTARWDAYNAAAYYYR